MDGVSCQPFIEFGSPLESSLRFAAVAAAVVVVALMSWAKGALSAVVLPGQPVCEQG